MIIKNLNDLAEYWGEKDLKLLGKNLYNNTECGMCLQFIAKDGNYSPQEYKEGTKIIGVSLGSIVEGGYEIYPREILFPFTTRTLNDTVQIIEDEVEVAFNENNDID